MNGIDGMRMVNPATSMYESLALAAASRRAQELRHEELEGLASMITSKIVDAWNKGQKS